MTRRAWERVPTRLLTAADASVSRTSWMRRLRGSPGFAAWHSEGTPIVGRSRFGDRLFVMRSCPSVEHLARALVAGSALVFACAPGAPDGPRTPSEDAETGDPASGPRPGGGAGAGDAATGGSDGAAGVAPPDAGSATDAHAPIDARRLDAGAADTGGDRLPSTAPAPGVLPVLLIDVGGKSIPNNAKIPGRVRIIENHDGTLKDLANRTSALDSPIGIGVRGNTSSRHPMKSYNLELRDAAGMDRAAPVLGMPAESDWVLYAAYFDKSRLRNAFTYALAREIGRGYNVRSRFAEVFLDGKYNGLYLVVEKIKRDKNRVNMPAPAPDAAAGDLSGGYVFRHEAGAEYKTTAEKWRSAAGPYYIYHEPQAEEITSAQKTYLHNYVDRFQTMFAGADWADPAKGYRSWIDLPTWVDYALITELSYNVDGYRKSVYFVKKPEAAGGQLLIGPVWDFDFAYGLVENTSTSGLQSARAGILPYWTRIWKDVSPRRSPS